VLFLVVLQGTANSPGQLSRRPVGQGFLSSHFPVEFVEMFVRCRRQPRRDLFEQAKEKCALHRLHRPKSIAVGPHKRGAGLVVVNDKREPNLQQAASRGERWRVFGTGEQAASASSSRLQTARVLDSGPVRPGRFDPTPSGGRQARLQAAAAKFLKVPCPWQDLAKMSISIGSPRPHPDNTAADLANLRTRARLLAARLSSPKWVDEVNERH